MLFMDQVRTLVGGFTCLSGNWICRMSFLRLSILFFFWLHQMRGVGSREMGRVHGEVDLLSPCFLDIGGSVSSARKNVFILFGRVLALQKSRFLFGNFCLIKSLRVVTSNKRGWYCWLCLVVVCYATILWKTRCIYSYTILFR
jgi:hypothetical protein